MKKRKNNSSKLTGNNSFSSTASSLRYGTNWNFFSIKISQRHCRFLCQFSNDEYYFSKTLPIFKGKRRIIDRFTPNIEGFTSSIQGFTPIPSRIPPTYIYIYIDITHKAVRLDVRVKISWHPHPAYPPLDSPLRPGFLPSPTPFGV
jgi:hypothetical protein